MPRLIPALVLVVLLLGGCSDNIRHVDEPTGASPESTTSSAAVASPTAVSSPRLTRPPDPLCYGTNLAPCLEVAPGTQSLATEDTCAGTGRRICIAPVGSIDPSLISYLVQDAHDRLGLTINVLPPLAVPTDLVDSSRGQVKAVALERLVKQAYPGEGYATVIGITSVDFYPEDSPDLPFYFGSRWGHGNDRWRGIISMARMDPVFFGDPADPALLKDRLRKMFASYVAKLYYGYSDSSSFAYATYGPITGLIALDRMSDALPPDPAPCWGESARVCLVPVNGASIVRLRDVAASFQSEYGIRVDVLDSYSTNNGINVLDNTYDAGVLRDELVPAYARLGSDPNVRLIGVTPDLLFSPALLPTGGAAFKASDTYIVSEAGPTSGIVSMKAPGGTLLTDDELRKAIDQQIALLYFHLPVDPAAGAPLHSPVRSLADIDAMPPKAAPDQ